MAAMGRRNRSWTKLCFAGLALRLPLGASEKAPEFMCQCDFQDNNWVHDLSAMLIHIQDLPKTLSNAEDPSTQWILQQSCEEDATMYPNSKKTFDIHEVLQLQEADATTVHNSCLPGHLAMSMVCSQHWIAKKSLMGVVKWISKMNELMTVVNVCMDQHSPVPFHLDDFTRYMERFAGGVPPPQHPAFVQSLAWPTKAVAKQTAEVATPLLECLPLKDPTCFPRNTKNPFESCAECCDLKHGPLGQERCWQDGFDFQRCCNAPAASGAGGSDSDESAALKKSLDEELKKKAELEKLLNLQKESLKTCEDDKERKMKELQSQTELVKGLQEASKSGAADGAEIATLRAEKEELQKAAAEVPVLKKSLAEVEGKLKTSEAKVQEAEQLGKTNEANLAAAKASADSAAKTTDELQKLRAEMEKKEAESQKKDAEMKKKDAELQTKNAEIEKQKATMKKKEEEFEKKESAMVKLEATVAAREKEASAAQKKEADLQKRLDEAKKQKEAEIQQLQAQLKEAQGKQGKPEVELQKTKEELKKSQQKAQQDAQEVQKLRAELDQLKGAKSKEQSAEIEKMKGDIMKANEKSKKDVAELQRLQDDLQSQKKQFEASQKKLQDAEKAAAEQQKKFTELEVQRKELDAELRRVSEEAKAKQLQKEVCQAMAATPKDLQKELKDLLGVGPS